MTDLKAQRQALAEEARRNCLEIGDYWDRSAKFLLQIGDTPKDRLTKRQRDWLHGLEQDLIPF